MLKWIKGIFNKPKTEKDQATENNQPYVKVISVELDKNNPQFGSFELDWNKPFIQYLRLSGYSGTSDEDIVDKWFSDVCRNVAVESWEHYDAPTLITKVQLPDFKSEYR